VSIVRVKGFQIFRDRHGKWRCYHRASGAPIDLEKYPLGSAGFLSECGRLTDLKLAVSPKPGTLGRLVEEYRASSSFANLADRTRNDYQRCLDYLKPIIDTPLARFDKPLVVRARDKAATCHGRRFGNYVKAVLSIVFAWGLERGYLSVNPAADLKDLRRPKGTPEANRAWTDAERHAVLASSPPHLLPAIALMMFTGLGPKDALRLPRTFYRNDEIATRRSKTEEPVFWPAPSELRRILNGAPMHNAVTLCANSLGVPWTEGGFRASWRNVRLALERQQKIGPGLTLYGLRHTVAVILREAGHDERTIADALGQKTIEMARHYAKGADLRRKMTSVVTSFDTEVKRRRTGNCQTE
jgi:integrase